MMVVGLWCGFLLLALSWGVHCAPAKKQGGSDSKYAAPTYSSGSKPNIKHQSSHSVAPNPSPVAMKYQAGELTNMQRTLEYGDSESETEQLSSEFQPSPSADYQPGELSHLVHSVEYGDSETETEQLMSEPPVGSRSPPQPDSGAVGGRAWYPHYDRFLTGQLPPGTITHYSSSYEQGNNQWSDTHYIREHPVSAVGEDQVKTFPSDGSYTLDTKQPAQSQASAPDVDESSSQWVDRPEAQYLQMDDAYYQPSEYRSYGGYGGGYGGYSGGFRRFSGFTGFGGFRDHGYDPGYYGYGYGYGY